MEASVKFLYILGFVAFLGITTLNVVNAVGECMKTSPEMEAYKLAPCASAAGDPNASVSSNCCATVQKSLLNPTCFCAVILSNTAKSLGFKPEVALSIPKRCNLRDRPVGYKCGAYSLP